MRNEILHSRGEPLVRNPRHLRIGVAQAEELVEASLQRAGLDVKLGHRLPGAGQRRRCILLHLREPPLQRGGLVELCL